MLVAILLGVAVRNTKLIPAACEPGIGFSAKTILRSGVVLLGFRLSLPAIAALGAGTIVTIICAVAVTMVAGYLLTYFMRVSHAGLGLSPTQAAVWLGASIHEVGQVVAAANIYDPAISDLTTATKLGRVACLAIVVAIVGIIERRVVQVRHEQAQKASSGKRPPLIPGFVVGFQMAVALASVFASVPTVNNIFSTLGGTAATLFLTVAMGAMGAGVNLRNVIKSGGRALVLGIILSVLIAAVSLGTVLLLVD